MSEVEIGMNWTTNPKTHEPGSIHGPVQGSHFTEMKWSPPLFFFAQHFVLFSLKPEKAAYISMPYWLGLKGNIINKYLKMFCVVAQDHWVVLTIQPYIRNYHVALKGTAQFFMVLLTITDGWQSSSIDRNTMEWGISLFFPCCV